MDETTHPRETIGLTAAIALVAGNMIGSGLFLLPASLAPFGTDALLGWIASAFGALAVAFVFARLGARWPHSGGPYVFARAAFGDGAGFTVAWSYWISNWCANAAIAIAFAGSIGALIPGAAATPLRAAATAIAAIWLCTLVNALGVRSAGRVQIVTGALKLLPLIAITAFAIPSFDTHNWQVPTHDGGTWTTLGATTALTLWAFLGIECATIPGGAVRDPVRNVPRATLIGATIAIVVTIGACVAVAGIVPSSELAHSTAPFADAAARLWGGHAGALFAFAAAVACFGALNGWVLMLGHLPLAIARDGLFPSVFARTDARGTPLPALLIGSTLSSLLVLANYDRDLVGLFTFSILLSTAVTLVPYAVCSAAELRVADRHSPMTMIVTAGAFVFSIGALASTGRDALLWGVVLLLAGWPLYRSSVARRARALNER